MELTYLIRSKQAKDYFLYFDEKRIGEEVKNNLVSISASEFLVGQGEKEELINALLEVIDQIGLNLKTRYPNRETKFCLWFDQGEELLRWTVISGLGQSDLPFSSKIEQVSIKKVVENWLAPRCMINDQSKPREIEKMNPHELRALMNSLDVPTLDLFLIDWGGI